MPTIPAPPDITQVSWDLADVTREDISAVLDSLLVHDDTVLSRCGISGVAYDTTHAWTEEYMGKPVVLANAATGAITAAAVSLVLAAGEGLKLRIGALLKDTLAGQKEIIQVTDIVTDTLTIVRGYGTTVGETHANGAEYLIVSTPMQEGHDLTGDERSVKLRSKEINYTQIFQDAVKVSGTNQAVRKVGVKDELAHQIELATIVLKDDLNRNLILGQRSATAGSDAVLRTFGGLTEFLMQTGANYNTDAEALSVDVLNEMAKSIHDDGGKPNLLAVSPEQFEKFEGFDTTYLQLGYREGQIGRAITHFRFRYGWILPITVDRFIPADVVMLLDTTRIQVMPLQSRQWQLITPAPTLADATIKGVLGEYTCEIKSALYAHALHDDLTGT